MIGRQNVPPLLRFSFGARTESMLALIPEVGLHYNRARKQRNVYATARSYAVHGNHAKR